jgi:hypothetical protein
MPTQILGPSGEVIPSAEIEGVRTQAMLSGPITDYETPYRASSILAQDTAAWRSPLLRRLFGRHPPRLTLARIHDLVRNDPHASAALDKLIGHSWTKGQCAMTHVAFGSFASIWWRLAHFRLAPDSRRRRGLRDQWLRAKNRHVRCSKSPLIRKLEFSASGRSIRTAWSSSAGANDRSATKPFTSSPSLNGSA